MLLRILEGGSTDRVSLLEDRFMSDVTYAELVIGQRFKHWTFVELELSNSRTLDSESDTRQKSWIIMGASS